MSDWRDRVAPPPGAPLAVAVQSGTEYHPSSLDPSQTPSITYCYYYTRLSATIIMWWGQHGNDYSHTTGVE